MFVPSPLPRTRAAALRDLASENERTRVAALRDLAPQVLSSDEDRASALKAIAVLLTDTNALVRVEAATALADLGALPEAASTVPALLRAAKDDHPHVAQFALVALVAIDPPRAREAVLAALADERPELRYQATIGWTAVEKNDALWLARHRARLADSDEEVRYVAVRIFEERVRKTGSTALNDEREVLVPLLDDTSDSVALAAAIALGTMGDRRGVSLLTTVVADRRVRTEKPAPEDEAEAVELAGTLGLKALIPALQRRAFGILRHVRDTCSLQARTALAQLGDDRARTSIAEDLAGDDKKALAAAVSAARAGLLPLRATVDAVIERIGDDRAVEEVRALWSAAEQRSTSAR